jgi:hypothetical protein
MKGVRTRFILLLLLSFTFALTSVRAEGPASTNYKLRDYGFGSGGSDQDGSNSTNYKLFGSVGEVDSGNTTNSVLARDTFTRATTSSWGNLDQGGTYSLSTVNGANISHYSTNGSEGVITMPSANAQHLVLFNNITTTDTDLKIKLKTSKLSSGADASFVAIGRSNGAGMYRPRLRFSAADNKLYLVGQHFLYSTTLTTNIGTEVQVPGMTHQANTYIWLRASIVGTNPTTINMKVWPDNGTEEPVNWHFTTTDSTAGLQASGKPGIMPRNEFGATNSPLTFTFDEITLSQQSKTLGAGLNNTLFAHVPPAPALSNDCSCYNKLKLVVNKGANPDDTKFSVAISSDNFSTSTMYVQNDGTIGTALGSEDWQNYTNWGGSGGTYIVGLDPGTTYAVKVSAIQGDFTQSGYGPTANAATTQPTLSFDIDVATTDAESAPPFLVNLGELSAGSVSVSSSKIWVDFDTNTQGGGYIYMKGSNSGLLSSSSNYKINAVSSNLVSLDEGYGFRGVTATQSSGGPFVILSPYNGAGNNVGTADQTPRILFDTSGAPLTGGRGAFEVQAKASSLTKAGSDYSDILTIVAVSSF